MARRKLTERQKARIAKIQDERRERMTAKAESALSAADSEDTRHGQVVIRHGQHLVVADEEGRFWHCLFRQNMGDIVCGDRVIWQPTGETEGVVTARLERDSALARPDYSGREKPIAANISQLVVVLAPEPEPTGYLVDQYLITAELIGVKALIALNKADLMDVQQQADFRRRFAHYEAIGYPLIQVSAKREHGLDPLIERLRGENSILVGQSGVGKSSLVNALIPDQDIQEGRLSHSTGLGRHTTSSTTLFELPTGGQLIDSPGVRSFRISQLDRQKLEQGFREFAPYLGHCKFSNCAHEVEPDCALREAMERGDIHPERLDNFRHMLRNLPPEY